MARIRNIRFEKKAGKAQPTEVEALVSSFGEGPEGPFLQIDTFGSKEREFPGKLSQTLQLDRKIAIQLKEIIQRIYG